MLRVTFADNNNCELAQIEHKILEMSMVSTAA